MLTAPAVPAERPPAARVLVVEDDSNIRDLVELHLRLEGLSTLTAADGNQGLALAKAEPFDLLTASRCAARCVGTR
jgi:CheY-like chemotaxis protein